MILGCREKGRQRDGPLDHSTGKGWVKAHAGSHRDAYIVKKSKVITGIVESTGGITPSFVSYISRQSKRAKRRDGTRYGRSATSIRSYFSHHVQRIGLAAKLGVIKAIRINLCGLKQQRAAGRTGVA